MSQLAEEADALKATLEAERAATTRELRALQAAALEYVSCDGSRGDYDGGRFVKAQAALAALLPTLPAEEVP